MPKPKTEPAPLKYDAPFQSAYDVVLTSLRVHAKDLPVATASAIATDIALKFRSLDEALHPHLNELLVEARGDGRVQQATFAKAHSAYKRVFP